MTSIISIAPLEFMALMGQLMAFGNIVPKPKHDSDFRILMQTDSVTSTWKLRSENGSSPLMIQILDWFTARPEFSMLKSRLDIGHCFGEGNPLADNLSRGDLDIFHRTCHILGVVPTRLHLPAAFSCMMNTLCDLAEELAPAQQLP